MHQTHQTHRIPSNASNMWNWSYQNASTVSTLSNAKVKFELDKITKFEQQNLSLRLLFDSFVFDHSVMLFFFWSHSSHALVVAMAVVFHWDGGGGVFAALRFFVDRFVAKRSSWNLPKDKSRRLVVVLFERHKPYPELKYVVCFGAKVHGDWMRNKSKRCRSWNKVTLSTKRCGSRRLLRK